MSDITERLLKENVTRKSFVDGLRMDIVNGREVTKEDLKFAIQYLREDAIARGVAQAKANSTVAKAKKALSSKKKPAKAIDADALLGSLF